MIAAIAGLAVLAGFIQTVTGFGAGSLLMAVFPYFFSMTAAPALSSSICWGLNLMLTWQYRKAIEWKIILLPGLCYIVFALLSIQFVGKMNYDALTIAFGVFFIILSVYFFFFSKKLTFKGTTGSAVFCSVISGICSGLFGVGGPLMAVYYVSVTDKRETYIASLQTIFAVNGLTILLMRLAKGYYTADMIPLTLAGIAGMFLGKVLGVKSADKLDGDRFKKIVYAFVGISGLVTIIETLL
jgi:uncharacterized membrane protein YfcA